MPDKPCICIFSALYAPSAGGVEIFTENLAVKIAELGYRALIVTSNTHGLETWEHNGDVEIVRLPCTVFMKGRLPLPKRNGEFNRLLHEVENTPMDGMIINTRFYPLSKIAAELAERKGIRPVLLDHGSAHLTLGNPLLDVALRGYEHAMTSRIKRHDMDFYGISDASAQWLNHFGITPRGVINNAMDAGKFAESASSRDFRKELSLPPDAFLVTFTGRLVPEKGIRPLLQAAKLLSSHESIHLLFAGDGPLYEEVNCAGSNVHALGRLSRMDIAAALIQSDSFCLPTRSEGFSTSLLEAAVCGCAPIITRVGGVAELIPEDGFGIVIDDVEPQTIANAMLRLLEDRERCNAMGSRIKQYATSQFTWEVTAGQALDACAKANPNAKLATHHSGAPSPSGIIR